MTATPFLKWVGGKTRLLPELLRRAPEDFETYHEPFLGGGAMFFALGEAAKGAHLSDANQDLAWCYKGVAQDPGYVAEMALERARGHNKEAYYRARTEWNQRNHNDAYMSTWERAALFIYLNKTCFNGVYRVNRKGEFNVPAGSYVNVKVVDPEALAKAAMALQGASIECRSFETVLDRAQEGDFVYMDPPYVPASATSDFTAYTADGFGEGQHRELASVFRELDERGCRVMLSNSDTPLVRELYKGFNLDRVLRSGTISSKGTGRGPVGELIITNDYERRGIE